MNFVFLYIKTIFRVIVALFCSIFISIYDLCAAILFIWKKSKNINGKIVLITGGGNGLGRETAFQIAKHNCIIVIADIDLEAAQRTVKELQKLHNVTAFAYHVDVSDYNSVSSLQEQIKEDVGIVNILINNAGLITFVSLMEKEWTDVERVLKVNLHSHFWMTRVFLPDMIDRKSGHIVGISSTSAYFPSPYMITYSTTKHGVNAFMRCLSHELYYEGHSEYIKTTLVCPYFIQTREDLAENLNLEFPALKTKDAAKRIVKGILKEEEEVIIMKFSFITNSTPMLSLRMYRFIMEYLFRSHKMKSENFKITC